MTQVPRDRAHERVVHLVQGLIGDCSMSRSVRARGSPPAARRSTRVVAPPGDGPDAITARGRLVQRGQGAGRSSASGDLRDVKSRNLVDVVRANRTGSLHAGARMRPLPRRDGGAETAAARIWSRRGLQAPGQGRHRRGCRRPAPVPEPVSAVVPDVSDVKREPVRRGGAVLGFRDCFSISRSTSCWWARVRALDPRLDRDPRSRAVVAAGRGHDDRGRSPAPSSSTTASSIRPARTRSS